ncbi:O-acyltransferase like protein-like [Trichoplusia ni]|uniref:O-acyltransferase like protein-like n=1 Tax=Trichoplusia ni TaxID=7111 RepID=A0A7E5W9M6_TRINI|nr:O-acyltransferase like protein-like [Trichoplusia ni]
MLYRIASSTVFIAAEYSSFPKLFHLDEFAGCLQRPGSLYCVGSFLLKPVHEPHDMYDLMQEYSSDPHNFNRSLLHRGYCVAARCPSLRTPSHSRYFERCASILARRQHLRASLTQLSYCRTHTQDVALKDFRSNLETRHYVFLCTVLVIVAINVIGTVYDVTTKGSKSKNKLLTSWSLVRNWDELVCPYPDGDPRLAAVLPVEGFRVIMILLVMFTHAGILHDMLFLENPSYVEEMSHHPVMMLLQNGTSSIQLFILLSSFLLAHSLLSMSPTPDFWMLPKLITKRFFRINVSRIYPVYMLTIGFAASWWGLSRDGPMWPALVGAESEVCRRKFWYHAFLLHNFVEPEHHCLVQTWFLAVDMQLYVVGCIITLCLLRARRYALPILGMAFVITCVSNLIRAYINKWTPLMFISVPDNIRTMFRHEPSFSQFYTSPAGSLPTCLLGLFVAFLHHHLREKGFKASDHKVRPCGLNVLLSWLITACQLTVPLLPAWSSAGHLLRHSSSRHFNALYIALERPALALIGAVLLFGVYNGTSKKDNKNKVPNTQTTGFLRHVFSWRGWFPLGRLSLAALMLHWCLNTMIAASSLTPITSDALHMVADWLATTVLTYLLAVPVTLLVDIPFQKFYSALTSK